jgi:hypothetical protein
MAIGADTVDAAVEAEEGVVEVMHPADIGAAEVACVVVVVRLRLELSLRKYERGRSKE